MQKTIRIFLSSTFTDTRVDRNKLMEEVFEPVRDLCQQHGIAFEVVDLRWGKNVTLLNKCDDVLGFKYSSTVTTNGPFRRCYTISTIFLVFHVNKIKHHNRSIYHVKFIKYANFSCQGYIFRLRLYKNMTNESLVDTFQTPTNLDIALNISLTFS